MLATANSPCDLPECPLSFVAALKAANLLPAHFPNFRSWDEAAIPFSAVNGSSRRFSYTNAGLAVQRDIPPSEVLVRPANPHVGRREAFNR